MNKLEKFDRNAKIYQLRLEGKTFQEIANTYNLSVARAREIAMFFPYRLRRANTLDKS